jgi:ABC-2 type transport system ATP-binding protein
VVAVAAALAAHGIAVEDLSLRQPSLDDVFLTLTGAPPEGDQP